MAWTSVSKISVVLETGEQRTATKDGDREHIGVVVTIQPTDDSGNPITDSTVVVKEAVKLIDYVDESTIKDSKQKGWYCTDFKGFSPKPSGGFQGSWQVYHSSGDDVHAKSIGVMVTTASGATFYSSLGGTFHSSVLIALRE
ncbi:hypothetical protein ACFU6R_19290 [Streptomyces sp. NPDC057499]|uniref:hypothetical protein n=1 Tax=Streptomyces sp. NPDC057499 TaxID=3346150 RepID=UPI003690BA18